MITLAEGEDFLKAISKMSKVGLFPFGVDVEKGRLSRPNWKVKTIWYLSLLLRAAHVVQQFDHMRSIYLLNSNHAAASPFHIALVYALPLVLILEIYLSVFKTDMFLLIFNEIFGGESQDSRRRSWKKMSMDDLIVRYMVPGLVAFSPWAAAVAILVAPKILLRPADLPRFGNLRFNKAFRFVCFIIDVYHFSLVVIQFQFEVFILIITCSKIVGSLMKMRKAQRYRGIQRERDIMGKAKKVELYCLLANHINAWIMYTVKMICLSCTVAFLFTVITHFGDNIVFSVAFLYASCLTTACYGSVCYFVNQVTNHMEDLGHHFTSKTSCVAIAENRLELLASIKSMRVVPVRVGNFHAMERESFLIFVDFVVNQLVSLLVVQST